MRARGGSGAWPSAYEDIAVGTDDDVRREAERVSATPRERPAGPASATAVRPG